MLDRLHDQGAFKGVIVLCDSASRERSEDHERPS